MSGFGGEGAQEGFLREIIGSLTGADEPPEIAFKSYLIVEIGFEDRSQL